MNPNTVRATAPFDAVAIRAPAPSQTPLSRAVKPTPADRPADRGAENHHPFAELLRSNRSRDDKVAHATPMPMPKPSPVSMPVALTGARAAATAAV